MSNEKNQPQRSGVQIAADGTEEHWNPAVGRWVTVAPLPSPLHRNLTRAPMQALAPSKGSSNVALPTPEAPRVKKGQSTLPSYLKTAKPSKDTALTADERRLANTDITSLRSQTSTRETIRQFIKASPDLSAAITSYVRTGITSGWTAIAYDPDGVVNKEATSAVAQIITRMNILNDYTIGYDDSMSIRALSEAWAKELLSYGGMGGELVLDKALLPDKIQPVTITQIRLYPSADGKKLVPKQELSGLTISLDVPTFFMVTLDQDLLTPYPESPVESAQQSVLFAADFMNDVRRIIKRALHPRMVATIDEEKFRKNLPLEVSADQDKAIEYMNSMITGLQDTINGLEPHEALVLFDAVTIEVIDHGNTNLSNEYEVIQGMADAKLSAGTKALPTVLGKSGGASNVASTEAMMFLKYVEGTVWGKLNEMFSKIFTLAVRLMGHDVYVKFEFDAINLKPEAELESFYAMRQSRVLELLSHGFLGDEEASIRLTGHLPGPQFKPLSGTGFFTAPATPAGDGYNGASNSGSALNQSTKANTPTGGARGDNKKRAEVVELRDVR